jgi:hypothetical protein
MLFPLDIVSQIVKYLPVSDATKTIVSLCPDIETRSLRQMKNEHRDPNIFFEDIVAEVPEFMNLMRMTRCMLIGIRAFSFFHHINVKSHHPWEFMCHSDVLCWLPFIDHLESRGMEWDPIKHSEPIPHCILRASSISGWIFSNGKRVKVSLTWITEGIGNIETVIDRFAMTPLQCVITGHEAIDPYGHLHSKKMYRLWEQSPFGDIPWLPNPFEAMNICEQVSMKPVTYEVHRRHDAYTRFRMCIRMFYEHDSIHINFDTPRFPSKGLYKEMALSLPVSKMSWKEDAYRVSASSFRTPMNIPFEEMREIWPTVSLPRLTHEYMHHNDKVKTADIPLWSTYPTWSNYMSDIFDDEDTTEDE